VSTAQPSRGRTILVAILGILACVAITLSATTLWIHQVALNTDRYVSVVSRVASDPQVVAEVSSNLAERVAERIDIPRLVKPLLENWLQEQIAGFMGTEAFAEGWEAANRAAHTALVRVLRSDAVLPEEPVTVSVSQLVVIGIERLQEVGVVPDDLQLPDPSDSAAAERIREVVSDRLDVDLPPNFGQITLVRPARLEMARQIVRIFDFLAVASVFLAIGLVAVTIYLARDRLRAVLLLGIGAAVALLATVAATGAMSSVVAGALAEGGARGTLTALLNALLGDLATALMVVLVFGALTVLAVVLIGRSRSPAAAMAAASPVPVPWPPPMPERDVIEPTAVAEPGTTARKSTTRAKSPPKNAGKSTTRASSKAPAKPPAKAATKPRAKPPAKPPPTSTA
jgi:hypothetical protein